MSALARAFEYTDGAQIRTVLIDDEPWFVAADILALLGLHRSSLTALDDDERAYTVWTPPAGSSSSAPSTSRASTR